ncbi:DUF3048 domain-containing protein [Geobacillus sp. G4]|uniref:DUF3048 domain-containing protein n=1 Tax=Geobacillus TaxID=129337 RepID=UPI0002E943A9|nr:MULTISPECIES: DUF3048 domain-containing protein [Geobacillus]KDE50409.1 hypothetical protein DI44_18065 [Geobacillus sp. CAMR5420]MBW7644374.1 DUF3048 domain-containing protein [Geobacillus thermoleovorans]WMJ20284.1 DUF3048 domain-containing protein [Geobacillus kaustophilus]
MKHWLFVISCAALLLLGGCTTKSEPKQAEPAKPAPRQEQPSKPPAEEKQTFPLTGLPAKGNIHQRVVGVMINNHPKARPQSGLRAADIVYEVLAEGDITRLLALYQSELPERVGPVRSARDYYIDLSEGYHALYVCHGWSPEAKARLEGGGIDYLNGLFYDGTLFQRVPFRKAPHNSYISFANIEKGAKQNGYAWTDHVAPLSFRTDEPSGQKVETVHIAYSHRAYAQVEYQYVPEQKGYYRYSGGEQTIDYDTHKPVVVQNVMIIAARHRVIDSHGRRDIDLASGGKGYLLQGGVMQPIEWKNVDGRLLPYHNGAPIGFVPGKTWINIVPELAIVQWKS